MEFKRSSTSVSRLEELELAVTSRPNNSDDVRVADGIQGSSTSVSRLRVGSFDGIQGVVDSLHVEAPQERRLIGDSQKHVMIWSVQMEFKEGRRPCVNRWGVECAVKQSRQTNSYDVDFADGIQGSLMYT
ncbi:hypothetical protein AVEN_80297-1 [Araneus ventricosus]|uniref:Uncharacterized protein n=1 Tax=Araneus ventricosus TaxID=182803 RepID=A0A4Y2IIT0_ARAVE|nr:hypothetical protein AVEN_80297-1 [Araneus ventricosus]